MQENELAAGHLTRHVVQFLSLRVVVLLFPCTIDSTRLHFKAQIFLARRMATFLLWKKS